MILDFHDLSTKLYSPGCKPDPWSSAMNIQKQYGVYFVRHREIRTRDPDHNKNVTIDALDRSALDPAWSAICST